jgi:hypothetical protein
MAGGALVVLLLVVLLLKSCGDDSLSEGELRTQAGAICARVSEATDRVAVPNAPAGGERFLREGLVLMIPAIRRLRELKAPEKLRGSYEHAIAATQHQLDLIADELREIRSGGDAIGGFQVLQRELDTASAIANSSWTTLHIPACVSR